MSSSKSLRLLTSAQVKRLYSRHIAAAHPTQPAMLDSAVDSPINHHHYGESSLFQLAGILGQKVALNHSYQDGNKRSAMFAADMFLRLNGHRIAIPMTSKPKSKSDDEVASAHVDVATNKWSAEDLGRFYATISELDD